MINYSRGAPAEGAAGNGGIAKPRHRRNRYCAAELLLINPHLKWGLLTLQTRKLDQVYCQISYPFASKKE